MTFTALFLQLMKFLLLSSLSLSLFPVSSTQAMLLPSPRSSGFPIDFLLILILRRKYRISIVHILT